MNVGAIGEERRARNVAMAGLLLQAVLSGVMLILWTLTRSSATLLLAIYMGAGTLIWFAVAVVYDQRRRVAREALETEQLRAERQVSAAGGLFDLDAEELLVQQRRLRWAYRWLLPFFAVLEVLILLGAAWMFKPLVAASAWDVAVWPPISGAKLALFCAGGVAFVAFLFSRYAGGMARSHHWRMLRSGAVYLFGNALLALLLVLCLALVDTTAVPEHLLSKAIAVLMLVLGLEFAVNFVLDFYRPRSAREDIRPAFESRLLGLLAEPGEIAQSIAEAVNYQFGFEVSATWFYQTLQQNTVRLAAVCVLVLVGMTCMVIVDADELAIKERWGQPAAETWGPGLHFKWPWPAETVRKADIRVKELVIGEAQSADSDEGEDGERVTTWTEEHKWVPSIDLLVATPQLARLSEIGAADDRGTDVAVSILRVSMPVQYRVRPGGLRDYLYGYIEPTSMLRDVAQRELVKQAVHFDYQRIMAEQRETVSMELQQAIQAQCDKLGLGLQIVFVGIGDIHPPTESQVAATFQSVATAEQQREALIQAAQIEYATRLIAVTGDVQRGEHIDELIRERGTTAPDQVQRLDELDTELQRLMLGDPETETLPVRGNAGEALSRARASALRRLSVQQAKASTFDLELSAYQAAPELYMTRKLLDSVSSELDDIRKYVLVIDRARTKVVIEWDERSAGGLEFLEQTKKN